MSFDIATPVREVPPPEETTNRDPVVPLLDLGDLRAMTTKPGEAMSGQSERPKEVSPHLLERLTKWCANATGGPWQVTEPIHNDDPYRVIGNVDMNYEGTGTVHTEICEMSDDATNSDAELIAECREAIPQLVRFVDAVSFRDVRTELPEPRVKVLATNGVDVWFDRYDPNFPYGAWCGWSALRTQEPQMPTHWAYIVPLPEPRF